MICGKKGGRVGDNNVIRRKPSIFVYGVLDFEILGGYQFCTTGEVWSNLRQTLQCYQILRWF